VVQLSSSIERDALLRALDEHPQTAERLAERLGADLDEVEAKLQQARQEGLATDWGDVWATSWRAKLDLAPRFFALWVPASIALGSIVATASLYLNGPDGALPIAVALALLAAVGAALAGLGAHRYESA
jgi:hypothetical protein